jgi:hypothetical protein
MVKAIPLTQGKIALVDDENYAELNKYIWYVNRDQTGKCYAKRKINTNGIPYILSMHRAIMNPPSDMMVDHINHDSLDNRKINLRICTCVQNQKNHCTRKNTPSKLKGVYWRKERNRWVAHIKLKGKDKL